MVHGWTSRDIAEELGVPIRRVGRWRLEGRWTAARKARGARELRTQTVGADLARAIRGALGKLLRAVQHIKAETPEQAEALARAVHLLADVQPGGAIIQEQLDAALSGLLKARKRK